ncbi:MAG: hypothetical protein ACHQ6V_04175 [Myxococcota bacterium]
MYAGSLSRRALLRSALAATCCGWAAAARAQESNPRAERIQRIADGIAEYDAQGEHRTGTPVDEVNARWIVRELAGAGLSARLERFDFERFVQRRADVLSGNERRHGLAAFDGGITGPEGVSGRLGRLGSAAEIGVAFVAPSPKPAALVALERARVAGTHRAIVVLPERGAEHGDLALLNAERAATPDSTPLVQLAGTHAWPLEAGAAAGTAARVVVEAERIAANGLNVTARVRGTQPELPPLVVMTPRSGWFACASERGGGLVALFEIARALYDAPPARDVVLVVSSGHELGHLGLRAWLSGHGALAASAHAWLHLGANVAALDGQLVVQPSSPELADLAREAFRSAGRPLDVIVPPGTPPLGEAREIADRPYLSVLGTNPRFHSPDDRWPYAVDAPKALAVCEAVVALARRLAS